MSEDLLLYLVLGCWGLIGGLALGLALLQKRGQKSVEPTNCNVVNMHKHRWKRRI